MRRRKRMAYIEHVVSVLGDEFEWDDTTRDICRSNLALNDYDNGFPPWFEFICDDPRSALWRLKSSSTGPWDLRVSFYGRDHYCTHHAEELTSRLCRD